MKRVLVVKMSSLGDVIHTLPALTDAARAVPGIRFDWVVEEAFAEIPSWHPAVDRVIPVALRRWRKRPLHALRGPEWRAARNKLQDRPYDAVIDAQGLLKSAFIVGQVPAPRYGMDWRTVRERFATAAYQHRVYVPRDMHAVERTRLLFARSLRYRVPKDRGDYGIRSSLAVGGVSTEPVILFLHGSARSEKLWPQGHWEALGRLASGAGYRLALPWGNPEEHSRAQRISAGVPAAEVLPRMDLRQLANLLLRASGSVAVDTGLGHLAAALDIPTVSLYGPTSVRLIGAYGQHQVHMESPADRQVSRDPVAVMQAISATRVWQELQAILPEVD